MERKMREGRPVVYVGIVTYNSAKLIPSCIEGLLRQTYQPMCIVVLDNNSHDDIDNVIHAYPTVLFIKNRVNTGFGRGHNAIIQRVKPRKKDYYFAVNPDVLLDPQYVQRLVRSCKLHRAVWATGKLYKDNNRRILYSAGHALLRDGYAFNIGFGLPDSKEYNRSREVFGASGAAALYGGDLLRGVSRNGNFFDPALFMYYEDVDIDWRARLAGKRCWYEASATAVHPGGTFPRALEAQVLSNRFLSIMKNAYVADLLFYNIPRILGHVLLRLVITPRVGLRIVSLFTARAFFVLTHRTAAKIPRQDVERWFVWSLGQSSLQPREVRSRAQAFFARIT